MTLRSRRARSGSFRLTICCALLFAACAKSAPAQNRRSATTAGSAVIGAGVAPVVTLFVPSEMTGYDPQSPPPGPAAMTRMFAVYDALVYQSPADGSVVPELAQSFSTVDGRNWLLRLRPGLEFSDGTPLDAAAVKFNWDRENSGPGAAANPAGFRYEVVDPLTLRVISPSVDSQLDRTIAHQWAFIASPTAIRAAANEDTINSHPVGAGPFLLQDWRRDSEATFTANPHYWNPSARRPTKLVVAVVINENQRVSAMETTKDAIALTTNPALLPEPDHHGIAFRAPDIDTTVLSMNVAKPPFDDPSVRHAVELGVDPDGIDKALYDGQADVSSGFFPQGSPYSGAASTFPRHDAAAAATLVAGYVTRTGGDLRFTLELPASVANRSLGELIQAQLAQIHHVHVSVRLVPPGTFETDLNAGSIQATILPYSGTSPDPAWMSLASGSLQHYDNPSIHTDITNFYESLDPAKRAAAVNDIQQNLIRDVPFFPLHRNPIYWLTSSSQFHLSSFDDAALLVDRMIT